ncbi:aromatase/cyclase [Saccharothrix australiensis]|uniref:Aromatase n=1 Tax=Saccharothrix australiensis TaxID=2072 RepID=A0A495W2B2_9PSEU|nr:aromatase/cyclase [Saccharothrix australiensis]RKT55609.1 aromatase [Saccharothrix australiensis]
MAEPAAHYDEHQILVAAPARAVYDIAADVTRWPWTFPPTVHAERLESGGGTERIRLWALANGEVKTWTSARVLDPEGLCVRFRQEVSQPPVAEMGGEWVMTPLSAEKTLVALKHEFRALDDDPAGVRWIREAVDRNSRAELEKLKTAAEAPDRDALTLAFRDSVSIAGNLVDVYDFLADAARWPERLPHVARLDLTEEVAGIQVMAMDTVAAGGAVHTTESVRVCFPPNRIVYKQTAVPALMAAHTGSWTLSGVDGAVTATAEHTVVLEPAAVPRVLGASSTVADARELVEKSLRANSTTTLKHARAFAEERRRG